MLLYARHNGCYRWRVLYYGKGGYFMAKLVLIDWAWRWKNCPISAQSLNCVERYHSFRSCAMHGIVDPFALLIVFFFLSKIRDYERRCEHLLFFLA